jgi:hypothetical protein
VTANNLDAEYDAFIERGRRWRELLPEGRYAWPLYDWDRSVDDEPPLAGHVVYWRRKGGRLSTILMTASPDIDTRDLPAIAAADENGDRECHLAFIVESPEKYAGAYGMRSSRCGFCHRPLADPKSREIGIGPECLRKVPGQ